MNNVTAIATATGTTAQKTGPASSLPKTSRGRFQISWLWSAGFLAILALLIVYPLVMLLLGSLSEKSPLDPEFSPLLLSFENYRRIFANRELIGAVVASLQVCLSATALASVCGVTLAWIIVRTDLPAARTLEVFNIVPLALSPLIGAIAWSVLGSPQAGLINAFARSIGLPFSINMYSKAGIVFVMGTFYAPYIYMFVASTLRNMDPALEDASTISGMGNLRTALTITLPLMMPALFSGAFLSFAVMLGIYSVPAVLGTPAHITVLPTLIYRFVAFDPPLYGASAAASFLLIGATVACLSTSRSILNRRSYITVTGKSMARRPIPLGWARWFVFTAILAYLCIVVVLPTVALIVASTRNFMFLPSFSALFDPHAYSLRHFTALFDNPKTALSLWNTIAVGLITMVVGCILAVALSYAIETAKVRGSWLIDTIIGIPIAVPGIAIGIGYLWAWIILPGGLWGSFWLLPLAFVARFIPDAVKSLSASFKQIHRELEEASWTAGVSRTRTIFHVILPLVSPGIASAATLLLVLSIREYGSALFITNDRTNVASVLLLEYYESSGLSVTAAFAIVQLALFVFILLIGRGVAAVVQRKRLHKEPEASK
ncbi:MAG TPA: iron ABC transporter permease [Herbaspirillum sp.]|jgi:iron(III) transport system permease protein